MAQYTIDYDPLRNAMDQFKSIQNALEDYSSKLQRISRDVQKGLEIESTVMANWSRTTFERSEDIGRASASLSIAIGFYHDAERLSYARLTEFKSLWLTILMLRNMPFRMLRLFGIFRLFRWWSNIPRFLRPNWLKLPALIHWYSVWLLFPFFFSNRRYALIRIWRYRFILSKLAKRYKREKATAAVPEQTGEINDSPDASDVAEGAGMTALPEEDFSEAEDAVEAEVGRAEAAIDTEGFDTSVLSEEYGSDLRRTGGSSGGQLRSESTPIALDLPDAVEVPEFTDTVPDTEYTEATVTAPPTTSEIPVTDSSATLPISANEIITGSGSGLAAPIIGAVAASSIAASGMGLGNTLSGKNKQDSGQTNDPELPVIAAKEATGNFSGNLKGDYVVLATAASLLFSGASLKAGIGTKKNAVKPDDRFRIGYGTSAVLCGGAIQERS